MTTHLSNVAPDLQNYLNAIGEPEHPVLTRLREKTEHHRMGKMAIAREQAAVLVWLAKLIRAEKYLEDRLRHQCNLYRYGASGLERGRRGT